MNTISLSQIIKLYHKNNVCDDVGFVDLDLPSGTLWATRNLGAKFETDFGLYFEQGDNDGYSISDVQNGLRCFDIRRRKYDIKNAFRKQLSELEKKDDAAFNALGKLWKIPTIYDAFELCRNTKQTYVCDYLRSGVKGLIVSSLKDDNKKIFLPFAGYANDNQINSLNDSGIYWTSSLRIPNYGGEENYDGYYFYVTRSDKKLSTSNIRGYFGFTIRPIISNVQ